MLPPFGLGGPPRSAVHVLGVGSVEVGELVLRRLRRFAGEERVMAGLTDLVDSALRVRLEGRAPLGREPGLLLGSFEFSD